MSFAAAVERFTAPNSNSLGKRRFLTQAWGLEGQFLVSTSRVLQNYKLELLSDFKTQPVNQAV